MAMPKKKMTNTRSGNRRGHIGLTRAVTTTCSNCKATIKPHVACPHCGFYRGEKVR